jgi:uncharacterized membrane protein required for colicin V production
MIFFVLFAIVFFASFAMMVREGLWSNTITLFNIVLSGLIAYGFYSPLTIWIDEFFEGKYTYLLDFLCIWAVFCVAMIVLRLVADNLSKTRLRLKNPLDPAGGPLMGLLAGWVMASFVMATLHTAPLAEQVFGGKLVHAKNDVENKNALTAPDLFWLRLVEAVSKPDGLGGGGFTAAGFVQIHRDHRAKLEKAGSLTVNR